MMTDEQLARIRATLAYEAPQVTNYEIADLGLEVVTDELIDRMIADSGGPREAVRDLLGGQLIMLKRQAMLIENSISMGYGRGRIRPHREVPTPSRGEPPLDIW